MKYIQIFTIIVVIILAAIILRGLNNQHDYEAIARANEAAAQEAQYKALREREIWEGSANLINQSLTSGAVFLIALAFIVFFGVVLWMHYQDWRRERDKPRILQIDEDDLIIM